MAFHNPPSLESQDPARASLSLFGSAKANGGRRPRACQPASFPGILGIAQAHGNTFSHENFRQVNRARLFTASSKTKDQGRCGENVPKGSIRDNHGALAGEMD
jgi:hypothetical protein